MKVLEWQAQTTAMLWAAEEFPVPVLGVVLSQ